MIGVGHPCPIDQHISHKITSALPDRPRSRRTAGGAGLGGVEDFEPETEFAAC